MNQWDLNLYWEYWDGHPRWMDFALPQDIFFAGECIRVSDQVFRHVWGMVSGISSKILRTWDLHRAYKGLTWVLHEVCG